MERPSSLRIRWAAIGAAIAVSLGGSITFVAQAVTQPASSGNTYTPITPCRLMDTRSGSSNVGERNTPIQGGTFYEASVHGANGNCTIPANTTGIATNTTVVNGSAASFLTLYPADANRPLASNLNWTAGQAATPNQVTVGLSPDGKIRIYNDRGAVNVIIDIVGIYFDPTTTLDDRYLTKAAAEGLYYSKASADDRYYTKSAADDHFATLEDLDDLKDTVRRTVSFPAQALNISPSQSADISPAQHSLRWSTNATASAHIAMHRPADFAGTGTVTVAITFIGSTGTQAGKAGFFVRPRNAPLNSPMSDVVGVVGNLVDLDFTTIRHTVMMHFPAANVSGEVWEFVLQRLSAAAIGPDASDMFVNVFNVSVSYDSIG